MRNLRNEVPGINIDAIYECEFNKMCSDALNNTLNENVPKEELFLLNHFLKNVYCKKAVKRLIPRERYKLSYFIIFLNK